jgi:hypothetical protein
MNKGEHLTQEGLNKILAIKASINRGLSDELKAAYPNTKPVIRPQVEGSKNFRSSLASWFHGR